MVTLTRRGLVNAVIPTRNHGTRVKTTAALSAVATRHTAHAPTPPLQFSAFPASPTRLALAARAESICHTVWRRRRLPLAAGVRLHAGRPSRRETGKQRRGSCLAGKSPNATCQRPPSQSRRSTVDRESSRDRVAAAGSPLHDGWVLTRRAEPTTPPVPPQRVPVTCRQV